MTPIEDALKGNIAMVAVAGAATLLLPRLLPGLAPPLRAVVKNGLALFMETEHETDGALIDRLVTTAVKTLVTAAASPAPEAERRASAQAAMRRFEHAARRRSQWHGWNEADRSARYRRHVRHLRRALADAQARATPQAAPLLAQAGGMVAEDW